MGRYRSARMDAIDGRIITPDGVVRGRVVLDGDVVAGVVPDSTAPDRWVCPGFIDLQLNGTHGVDLWTEPHRLDDVAVHLPDEGVTAFLATVITGPAVVRDAAIDATAAHADRPGNAAVLGLHLEGPVLSPDAHGAHPVEHLLYFSAIAIHWIVPSHPIHAMYTGFHLMMAPVPGHTGSTPSRGSVAATARSTVRPSRRYTRSDA